MPASSDSGKIERKPPAAARKIRVLIVDDHTIMRQGLTSLLQSTGDLEVVGSAPDGQTGIDMTKELKPDVVIMDASMPGMSGIEATRAIVQQFPGVRVVALSLYDEKEMSSRMRSAGAVSYVQKTGPAENLIAAIRTAKWS